MKTGKSLSIFTLLLMSIAVVLTSCVGDTSESSLKIWGVNEKVPMDGDWGACYGPGADILPGGNTTVFCNLPGGTQRPVASAR